MQGTWRAKSKELFESRFAILNFAYTVAWPDLGSEIIVELMLVEHKIVGNEHSTFGNK